MTAEFPCTGGSFTLPGPAGALEALTSCPRAPAARATAVICHPHTLHGGSLTNKVVHTLARSFDALGLHTVRFNFRGAGASAGVYDHGVGETDDLLAVLDWVRRLRPEDEIWLAGFSFGAYVSLRTASRFAVARLITIAPAVHLYEVAALTPPTAPWLLIQGDQDEVVPPQKVLDWAATLARPPELAVIPGVGHFFHQRLNDLRDTLVTRLGPAVPR
jgi:hypothetical protein